MEIKEFVNALYGDADIGWLTLFYTPSKKTVWFKLLDPIPEPNLKENCYLGLGIRNQPPEDESKRGKLEDVIGIPGLWLDLDMESKGAHKTTHKLPPNVQACREFLSSCPYDPTLTINSGHGLQVYWLFNEVWYFDSDEERDRAQRLCRGWQQWFQAKAKEVGWHVDSTADLTRVFRIPGTKNIKTKPYKNVIALGDPGKRFEPSDFDDFISQDILPTTTAVRKDLTPKSIDIRKIDRLSDRMKYLIMHGDTLDRYPSRSEAVFSAINGLIGVSREDDEIAGILLDPAYRLSEMPREKGERWLAHEIARAHQKAQTPELPKADQFGGEKKASKVKRISATDLLAKEFQPLKWFSAGILHEGNVIFAGKSKRGKSWVALNMALSLATGADVFGHYETPRPVKVAYCALEDGERRINRRLKQMDETLTNIPNLEFIFDMPPLNEGGLDVLKELVEDGVEVIIVDVLAKIESQGKNGQKNYHEVYETFAPLQALRNKHVFCLIMITHLRKAEAEDMVEGVMGSVAYVGAQDTVWVFNRKYGEDNAFLEILDKDAQEKTCEIGFDATHGCWTFIGEGDAYLANQEEKKIIEYLHEEGRPQSIREIMSGLGMHQSKIEALRKRLQRLVLDQRIIRSDRGKYAALPKSNWEALEDNDDMPF